MSASREEQERRLRHSLTMLDAEERELAAIRDDEQRAANAAAIERDRARINAKLEALAEAHP